MLAARAAVLDLKPDLDEHIPPIQQEQLLIRAISIPEHAVVG